jgi:hypothetical protein
MSLIPNSSEQIVSPAARRSKRDLRKGPGKKKRRASLRAAQSLVLSGYQPAAVTAR